MVSAPDKCWNKEFFKKKRALGSVSLHTFLCGAYCILSDTRACHLLVAAVHLSSPLSAAHNMERINISDFIFLLFSMTITVLM
jgi:hypothetical protein